MSIKATRQCCQDMKQRCLNPRHPQFKNYGSRGITVCDRWMSGFDAFLEDMGVKPDGMSLDRIDNDRGYSPENCRWADSLQQRRNQRRCTILSYREKSMTITEWANELDINPVTICSRLSRGCTTEQALYRGKFPPVHSDNPRHRAAMQEGKA